MQQAERKDSMTGSLATTTLGWASGASLIVVLVTGLITSPKDANQGEAVRLLYVHVPMIWIAYGSFIITAVYSGLFVAKAASRPDLGRHLDRVAGSAAEVGVVFTGLTLVSGALWGRITWGVYWQWDARLTTTVLMFVTYLGYLALRKLPADPYVRSRRAAIVALIATVNLPIVHYSVDWWRTLHQGASITVGNKPEYTNDILIALLFAVVAFTLVALWLGIHRYRVIRLEEIREEEGIEMAIAARRAEAEVGS
ncbi:MAG: cytochrome c biogenesis protein CcsA [Actinomycetota bacterium]|jgi:heme exporter protein C|nr:cytochrome c biogenesis protein CcsA [Actinomycetota bacterium]